MRIVRAALLGLAGLLAAACGGREEPAPAPEAVVEEAPVRVFAAASLSDALEEIAAEWMRQGHPGPVVNLAASSTLARQIEEGAEADVFISADQAWMDYLAERNLIDPGSRTDLVGNRLVLIAPADAPFDVRLERGASLSGVLGRLPGGGKVAIADPDSVPAGRYAREAFTALEMWSEVEPMLARTEDVRAALRFVTTGEADAGVVYRTDARAAAGQAHVAGEFPAETHLPIVYPAAMTARGGGGGETGPNQA
jgi:molybdate transport system substrate-binding protein